MQKKIAILLISFICCAQTAAAEMMLFVGEGCPHCEELQQELRAENLYQTNDIREYEIYNNEQNAQLYLEESKKVGYDNGGVPLLIDGKEFAEGTEAILAYLDNTKSSDQVQLSNRLSPSDSQQLNEITNELIKNPQVDVASSNSDGEQSSNTALITTILIAAILAGGVLFYFRRRR